MDYNVPFWSLLSSGSESRGKSLQVIYSYVCPSCGYRSSGLRGSWRPAPRSRRSASTGGPTKSVLIPLHQRKRPQPQRHTGIKKRGNNRYIYHNAGRSSYSNLLSDEHYQLNPYGGIPCRLQFDVPQAWLLKKGYQSVHVLFPTVRRNSTGV